MLDIHYLNDTGQEFVISYETYADYKQAQLACQINLADHYRVTKLTYKGHDLNYQGRVGDVYFFLLNHDLTSYSED